MARIESPHWFKACFLLKILGILTMRGEKDNFGGSPCNSGKSSLYEVSSTKFTRGDEPPI